MPERLRVDWEALGAARRKYRQLVREIEHGADHKGKLAHTASKLGMFLDEALYGAFRAADERAPDHAPLPSKETRA